MFGLVLLLFFIAVALAAPLLADPDGLDVTKATGDVLAPPSREYPLGTDDNGRSVLTLLIWGARVSLFVGLTATVIAMVIGTVDRARVGLPRAAGRRPCSTGSPSGSW